MLISVLYNTDEMDRYHRLVTTIYTSGSIEKDDVKTIVDVMKNYLHHHNVIALKHTMSSVFDADINDVIAVVKQCVKTAKQDWFKHVYCYKYKVEDDVILIYIGYTDRYRHLEWTGW